MSKGGGQGVIKRTGGEFDFGKSMFGKIQCEEFDRRRKRMFLPNPLQPQAIEGRFSGEVGKNMKSQTAVRQKTGGEIQCVFQVRQMLQHVVAEDHIECLWRKRLELIKAVESLDPELFSGKPGPGFRNLVANRLVTMLGQLMRAV